MKTRGLINALVVLVTFFKIGISVSHSQLSTFRTENLNINAPPACPSILDEAIWLMKTHFLKRHLFTETDWEKFREEFVKYADVHTAVCCFMDGFGDPYSRFIPEKLMTVRQRSIRGETVGVGLTLKRRWHLAEAASSLKAYMNREKLRTARLQKASDAETARQEKRRLPFQAVLRAIRSAAHHVPRLRRGKYVNEESVHVQEESLHHSLTKRTTEDSSMRPTTRSPNRSPTERSFTGIVKLSPSITMILQDEYARLSFLEAVRMAMETIGPFIAATSCFYFHNKRPWNFYAGMLGLTVAVMGATRRLLPLVNPLEVAATSGPSSDAGLQDGDRIIAVDGRKVTGWSARKVTQLLDEGEEGDIVKLRVIRTAETFSSSSATDSVNSHPGVSASAGTTSPPPASSFSRGLPDRGPSSDSSKSRGEHDGNQGPGQESHSHSQGSTSRSARDHDHHRKASIITDKNKRLPTATAALVPARVILDVDVVRESVFSRQVSSSVLSPSQGEGVGYLAIREFTQRTLIEVNEAIADLKLKIASQQQGKSMEALVIDLRGNLGGPLPPALDVAALFLPRGSILIQMSAQGKTERYRSTNKRHDSSTQILLLTDAQTASASEIFAAALRDNHRATSMGSKTLGKNVAQAMMMLSDGSGLAFTVREYLSPLGRSMGGGMQPDIEISEATRLDVGNLRWNAKDRKWNFDQDESQTSMF